MKKINFARNRNRILIGILTLCCLGLVGNSCARRHMTKYGGPPADYQSMKKEAPTKSETAQK